ncbi:PcfJ domain-containing protein [Buttiauxella sp. WJP83]|uniref:PcfJ domain-containing protein n=1 Tax=Buttiauxella sp. WJP83 TaxID=2986951 RepID=UPI0022DE607C|nr:PcfJ domain-containing protein [Buttiauxella sp. WJP83]WBM72773.1 PcfJ domain-containing protein [Buttiauxella sp. WJP83]
MSEDIVKTYQPRNIINSTEVMATITSRSEQRGDSEDIRRWLANHFYRWAIGSFPFVSPIRNALDYATWLGAQTDMPEWLPPKLTGGATFYYLDPQHPELHATERNLVEFLSRQNDTRLAGKLQRINCFIALEMREAEHKKMQRRRQQGWHPATQEVLKRVLSVTCGTLVEFDATHPALRCEMAYESWHMQHCVGQFQDNNSLAGGYGDYYAKQIEHGAMRLFSLRDENNIPHVTISMRIKPEGLEIEQIKGKQNRHPVKKYAADVLHLLRHIAAQSVRHADCEGMGIVYEKTPDYEGWKFISDIHDESFLLSVLHNNFHLLRHVTDPPVALQWLLLHSSPGELHQLQTIDPTVATAAEMLYPQQLWHPTIAGKNTDCEPFEIENVTLQTTRYLTADERK